MRSAKGVVVLVAVAVWLAGCSSNISDDRSAPVADTEIVGTTTLVTAEPASTGDVACPGFDRLVEILPADAGESSPEDEIRAFTVAFGQGLPTDEYLPALVSSTKPVGETDPHAYVHSTSDGRVDVRLTLVEVDGRWHVDSVLTCAG